MKKLIFAVTLTVMAGALFAGDVGLSFNGGSRRASAASAPAASAPAPVAGLPAARLGRAKPKEWTVMVFVNSKNNLEAAGLYNVNEMEKVGSTKDMNIVVEMGRMNGQSSGGDTHADGDWTGIRRYLIQKDSDENHISSPVLFQEKSADMGDYREAENFVRWAKAKFPARRYMLIIWNHGSGWLDPRKASKGISFDDETGDYIRTPQIGQILRDTGGVDILAYDACLMQMGEVAFEVKNSAKVIVGSEETVPGAGYPYSLFLGAMARRPAMSDEQTGAMMVEAFKLFYDKAGQGAQLSAIRTSALGGFAQRMGAFAAAARASGDSGALKTATDGVLRYDALGPDDADMTISFYGDVAGFAKLVADNVKGPKADEVKARAADLENYISKTLVIETKASGKDRIGRDLSESTGISVYLPPANAKVSQARLEGIFEAPYGDYAFDKATHWHDFVTYLYGVR